MAGPKNVDSRLTLRRRTSCRSGLAPWRNQQRNAMRIAEAQRRAACACAMRDKSRLTATDVRRAHAVAPKSISEVFGERRWSQPWIGSEWVADTRTDRDRSNGVIWAGGARKDELKVIADDDDDRARCLDARCLSWTWRELRTRFGLVRPGVTPRGVTLAIGAGGVTYALEAAQVRIVICGATFTACQRPIRRPRVHCVVTPLYHFE